VKLSSREQQAVALRPTENPEAYDAYLRGVALWNGLGLTPDELSKISEAYSRAVQLDPAFAIAWANLSVVQTLSYATYDPTAARLAEAKRALDTATKLQPDSGDAWFALGVYRYRALNDFDGALQAFEEAIERGANRAQALEFSGNVKRRQGKWDDALAAHAQAAELDPRNPVILGEQSVTFRCLRRFAEAHASLDRAIAVMPDNQTLVAFKAMFYQAEGKFDEAGRLIERLPVDAAEPVLVQPRFTQLMCTAKYAEAAALLQQSLATTKPLPANLRAVFLTHLGLAKRLAGDVDGGARDLVQGRNELETFWRQSVGEGYLEDLMMAEGVLGNRAAVDKYAAQLQERIGKDAFNGPTLELAIALSRAQLGQADEAIALLRALLHKPGDDCITTAQLRADPVWIPLRSDPRFQKLLEAP
jgi:tetratricopeptide (TPR) repeat protein